MNIGQNYFHNENFDHNDVKIEDFPDSNYENNLDRNIDPRERPKFSRYVTVTLK